MIPDPRAAHITERQLQEHVRRLCFDLKVRHFHPYRSDHSEAGFPDSVIVGPGGVLFREMKRQDKEPTIAQSAWLEALTRAGQDAGVWRPAELLDGTVARELVAVAR